MPCKSSGPNKAGSETIGLVGKKDAAAALEF
jgi:hypothetical protein